MNNVEKQHVIEVVVTCATWAAIAPWGLAAPEVIGQATIEAARRLAAEVAGTHCSACVIVVSEGRRVVEELRGSKPGEGNCEDADDRFSIERMIARSEDRDEIRSRISAAQGHGLISDAEADRLRFKTCINRCEELEVIEAVFEAGRNCPHLPGDDADDCQPTGGGPPRF